MLLVNIVTLSLAVPFCLWAAFIHPFNPEPLYYRIFLTLFAVRLTWVVRKLYRHYQQDFGRVIST
jgi:hypothetical protein